MKDTKIFINLVLNDHIMHNDKCIYDIGHIGRCSIIYKDVQSWTIWIVIYQNTFLHLFTQILEKHRSFFFFFFFLGLLDIGDFS